MTGGWTTRSTWLAAVLLVVLSAIGWFTYVREPPRHQVGELSCTSRTYRATAVSFVGIPRFDSPQDALAATLGIEGTLPRDGWQLRVTPEVARWERRDGSHLVGLVELPRDGSGWGYASADVCEETRTALTGR